MAYILSSRTATATHSLPLCKKLTTLPPFFNTPTYYLFPQPYPPPLKYPPFSVRTFTTPVVKKRRGMRRWFLFSSAFLLLPSTFLYHKYTYSPQIHEEELENTQKLYESKSTGELGFSLFILKLCSYNSVVELGPKLLEFAESHYLSLPAHWVVKHTFFRNFVPGETMEECKKAVDVMKKNGMGVILDYSVETGKGTKADFDRVADHIMETVRIAAAAADPSLAFGCLKISGLTSFSLLERVSSILQYYNTTPPPPNAAVVILPLVTHTHKNGSFPFHSRPLPPAPSFTSPPPPLSPQETQELREFMQRFDKICETTFNLNVPMLVDAEQTHYQPAIDLVTLYMCNKYNRKRPIVYNTYQMYLKDSTKRLLADIDIAKKEGFFLGTKLVRGAYMYSERERAHNLAYLDPVHTTIEDTHQSYHQGIDIALQNLGKVGLMIATHNENTVIRTLEKVHAMGIDPKNPNLQFAQLYGMADHLTLLLVHNNRRVFKYVPFGPVQYP